MESLKSLGKWFCENKFAACYAVIVAAFLSLFYLTMKGQADIVVLQKENSRLMLENINVVKDNRLLFDESRELLQTLGAQGQIMETQKNIIENQQEGIRQLIQRIRELEAKEKADPRTWASN
tara:strand:- start:1414 stop:1779 length:366 start_codon:yes stop_codon:yes gene_type:complete